MPFELANKKEINDIKNLYSYSFDKINNFNGIINYNTAKLFSDQLKNIKYMHGDVSYTIKDAFKNIVINQEQIIKTNTILDDFYYKRIGIRTIIDIIIQYLITLRILIPNVIHIILFKHVLRYQFN